MIMSDNYTSLTAQQNGQYDEKSGDAGTELQKLEMMLRQSHIPSELYDKAHLQLQRITMALKYSGNISQFDTIAKYVEWITSLPWEAKTNDVLDIKTATDIMNKNHYGLEQIKKRILEYLSILIMQNRSPGGGNAHAPILFFVGLAGTGKTTFAKSIADTLGRKFARIPFGGLSSALDLRGLSRVQPEAEPGQIIKALRRVQTKNPVILLDELDRITSEAHAAVMGVLLELLDPEQNDHFVDHYIDFPFDLSQVVFIATANNTQNISTAVMDRLEVIQMPSYSDEEKIHIGKNYVLPHLMTRSGLQQNMIIIDDEVWKHIARSSGYDPGIRSVERKIESIVRTAAYGIVSGKGTQFTLTMQNAKQFLD